MRCIFQILAGCIVFHAVRLTNGVVAMIQSAKEDQINNRKKR